MPELPSKGSFTELQFKNEKDRNYLIMKGNPLVQDTHYTMPLIDQKILASMIRSIKPNQTDLKVRFSTRRYMQMLGMRKSGTAFEEIKHIVRNISNNNFWMKCADGKDHLFVWIKGASADPHGKNKGDFVVEFNPDIKQYLFNRSKQYRTIYKFSDIMLMRSRYSPRLYEIFRSNQSRQKVQKRGLNYSIFELKYALNLMKYNKRTGRILRDKNGSYKFKYPAYHDFKRNVLIPVKKEINQLTEYNVRMTPYRRHGNKIAGINVVMLKKNRKEKAQRDDRIFFITHHVPKKEWPYWREDVERGKFHKIHKRKPKKVTGFTKDIPPFRDVNLRSGNKGPEIRYYSPFVHKFIWTSQAVKRKQQRLYDAQKKMIYSLKNRKN